MFDFLQRYSSHCKRGYALPNFEMLLVLCDVFITNYSEDLFLKLDVAQIVIV